MLSDPPDTATAILCERETPRSLKAEAKRCSKPEPHRLKPGNCMHRADGASVLTCGLALGWPQKCELAEFLARFNMSLPLTLHVPGAPSDMSDLGDGSTGTRIV